LHARYGTVEQLFERALQRHRLLVAVRLALSLDVHCEDLGAGFDVRDHDEQLLARQCTVVDIRQLAAHGALPLGSGHKTIAF
jgi:hypothetical protein